MFYTIVMSHIVNLFKVIAGKSVDRLSTPQYLAAIGKTQARENAQQAGFATTIRTLNDQHLTGFQTDIKVLEQQAVVARAA